MDQPACRQLPRSVEFYRHTLGMKLQQPFPGFAFFSGGGVTPLLSEPLFKARPGTGGAVEVVFSVLAVCSAQEALRGAG
jgi:catechol 2,3-dioxygenase-like lactoylglutathione lyase family enzyme